MGSSVFMVPDIGDNLKENKTELVLVDTDPGVDDAWALFLVLKAHKDPLNPTKIIGITCVNGNTGVDNTTVNATRVLNTAKEFEIPIYRGSEFPLIPSKTFKEVPPYFGEDGFGDAGFPPLKARLAGKDGVHFITKCLKENKGKISILAIGPLTNLALAIRQSPEIRGYPKRIIILGGTIQANGFVHITSEFNFAIDPEAARIVLETFTCPMIVLPWETIRGGLPLEFRTEVLGKFETAPIELLNKAEAKVLAKSTKHTWTSADPAAAAILLDRNVIQKSEKQYFTVELEGEFTRGMGVVDRLGFLKKKPNVEIVTSLNLELYKTMLIWAVGKSPLHTVMNHVRS